ncbi:MAG: hypothetical protein OER96_09960, partial [Gammaproteobacteria bacterium]|nr:hypothetical protein [Gammaproteobacteria bacterium]
MACTLLVANSYAQTENRLQSVAKLIESSSAATQIESSADPEAIARREDARALYRQAVEADQRGDSEGADQLLQKATQTMFEAVRLAGKDEVNGEKNRKDFALRMQSVEALMKAHQRISVEKKNGDADQFKQDIDLKLQRVQSLHDSGQLAQAREILDEVYVIAKTGIEELRDGDTLVRSLNFATKEEEYRYELDRNDTHEMLITVLLQDKMEGQKPNPMTQEFIDKATDLRFQAEKEASTGDYATAIRTLEDSTRQLVRAIRGAGIYIPG